MTEVPEYLLRRSQDARDKADAQKALNLPPAVEAEVIDISNMSPEARRVIQELQAIGVGGQVSIVHGDVQLGIFTPAPPKPTE